MPAADRRLGAYSVSRSHSSVPCLPTGARSPAMSALERPLATSARARRAHADSIPPGVRPISSTPLRSAGSRGGGGGGIVFPTVLIPVYGVPRALLTHSYSLIGLLRNTVRRPKRTESPHYGVEGMPAVGRSRSGRSV